MTAENDPIQRDSDDYRLSLRSDYVRLTPLPDPATRLANAKPALDEANTLAYGPGALAGSVRERQARWSAALIAKQRLERAEYAVAVAGRSRP